MERRTRVLLADGDGEVRLAITRALRKAGFEAVDVTSGQVALEVIQTRRLDAVVSELHLSGLSGLELLQAGCQLVRGKPWLVIAAETSVSEVVRAVKLGACDVWEKPVEPERLVQWLTGTLGHSSNPRRRLDPPWEGTALSCLVGESPVWLQLKETIWSLQESESTVLIQGESGVGKEVVARAIHAVSPRAHRPFVPVSCGSIPESLQQSELFGYEEGAFTGANHKKKGVLEAAEGSTLFLDEVGLMSEGTQGLLLRFLEDGEVRPLGSVENSRLDVRLIAATNVDLRLAVRVGNFRQDLYHRLKVIPLIVPPLRQRGGDVLYLAREFVEEFCQLQGRPPVTISPRAAGCLLGYKWPGNTRELKHAIEYALTLGRHDVLDEEDLPVEVQSSPGGAGRASLRARERRELLSVLEACGWVRKEAARRLGVSKVTLWRWMKDLNVQAPTGKRRLLFDETPETSRNVFISS